MKGFNLTKEGFDRSFYTGKLEIVIFNVKEKLIGEDNSMLIREATELEKEYWIDSIQLADDMIDGTIGDYDAVSLCEFDEWLNEKYPKNK